MANLYNSSLIPNITEIYYGSNGQVLQQDGNGLFHAQNNYSNLLYVYIEDGNGENTTTLINFSPKKFQSTIKPAFTSHWFFMSYRGIVQQTIEGEDSPRSFAQFAIVIPNTVLRYNSLSLTQNTVTVIQRYGESFLGVYSVVADLNNSYGDDTIYSPAYS